MTFVGKILVVVIMAFSLLFLGITSVVFTTERNWRDARTEAIKKIDELKRKTEASVAERESARKELENAKAAHEAAEKQLADRISALDGQLKQAFDDNTQNKMALVKAVQSARTAEELSAELRKETDLLRQQKSEVEKQANEYKLKQTELNDQIRDLARNLGSATNSGNDLRDRVARLQTLLRSKGLSDDISQIRGIENAPPVRGAVLRVNPRNDQIEISIGSDDGLVVGHELFLYRTLPRPEYLGKVRITDVDPDQAVARVINHTVQGRKIKEGDIVSSTIRPRS
jgi:hypothetical protein